MHTVLLSYSVCLFVRLLIHAFLVRLLGMLSLHPGIMHCLLTLSNSASHLGILTYLRFLYFLDFVMPSGFGSLLAGYWIPEM